MKISVLDASHYFRGLLLLIRKDRQVTDPEIDLMKNVGKALGFDADFCETAIAEILDNAYISDSPPVFSSIDLAAKFMRDGLALSFIDHEEIDPREELWLKQTCEQNRLGDDFFVREKDVARAHRGGELRLEAADLVVEYH